MQYEVRTETWALRQPFRIAGKVWTTSECIAVELRDCRAVGRGEGQGVSYIGESVAGMVDQLHSIGDSIRRGVSRRELRGLLPAGGARNAVDCALWDLEAKSSGRSIWELTGIEPRPVTTVFTIGLESEPSEMAAKAAAGADCPVLKIKLDADRPLERLAAIRAARPDATLVVDANQGWTFDLLKSVLPGCAELGLAMIEQPLPRGADEALEGFASPITLAADESCLDTGDLDTAARRYGMINIKIDKTGGLTEALELARRAKGKGLELMVGNMLGTSLGMAPSFVVAQLCDFVDLDGPLLLASDREHGMRYSGGTVEVFDPRLWG